MEIINPWLLYLVLQADSIRDCLDSVGRIFIAISVMAWIVYVIALIFTKAESESTTYSRYDTHPDRYKEAFTSLAGIWKRMALLPVLALSIMMAEALIPSTKSAAMLLVIPTIANSEVVQEEARELYDLAKLGLKELVDQQSDKPVPPEVQAMRDAVGEQ